MKKLILAMLIGMTMMIVPLMLLPSEEGVRAGRALAQELLKTYESENEAISTREGGLSAIDFTTSFALISILSSIPALAISIYVKKRMD